MRGILAELGTPSIPSAFPISRVHSAFDDDGQAIETAYDERVGKFLDEYEWYAEALAGARGKDRCAEIVPTQQAMCRGTVA